MRQAILLPHRGVMPRLAPDAFVAPGAVVVGDVEIGARSGVWFGCVLRGDVAPIRIGARTNVQDGTVIHVNRATDTRPQMPTEIGDDVTIGHQALIHAVTLTSGAFVGMRAIVMDGAVVEGAAMVAANACVTPNKRVPTGELWAGSPAKFMRPLSEDEMAGFPVQAAHYAEQALRYRAELGV